jgi:hypothetical protein
MMPGFLILIETRDGTVHTIAPPRAGTNDRGRAAPEPELEPPGR